MTAEERRAAILKQLNEASQPVSATVLAKSFGVSRQIIVGDVALLRAAGKDIAATPRGYTLTQEGTGLLRQIACCHTNLELETELNIIVDHGCTVLDVIVEHPVYGQLTGTLHLRSRYDVQQFLSQAAGASPLSQLTKGIHLHTLSCPDEESYRRVCQALAAENLLLEN